MTIPLYPGVPGMTIPMIISESHRDPEFRMSTPGGLYHFGHTIEELREVPGLDIRETASGETYVIVSDSDSGEGDSL